MTNQPRKGQALAPYRQANRRTSRENNQYCPVCGRKYCLGQCVVEEYTTSRRRPNSPTGRRIA